ncbi:MAG: hypothetical protein J7K40_09075 [candidate division Zixibacteria bacterium]|nr:hypothetical protein [candidate division Zixibacteria bacterium]
MRKIGQLFLVVTLMVFLINGCQDASIPNSHESQQKSYSPNSALQTAAIGDYIWFDENMDGIQEDIEMGLSDVNVNLYDCEENLIASAVADEAGFYAFEELEAGEYLLEFVAPENYAFSPQDQGDDDAIDSDPDPLTGMTMCFTLEEDTEDISRDAGLYMMEDDDCTYDKGFWKNHTGMGPQDDLAAELLPLWLGNEDGDKSLNIETAETAYNILQQHEYGHPSNGITGLYAHFLAAKLNIANGASDEDIVDLIDEADDFLADYDWNDWGDLYNKDRQMVNEWKGTFEDYNEGEIGPGHCNDDNELNTSH